MWGRVEAGDVGTVGVGLNDSGRKKAALILVGEELMRESAS
jgi:hypothetical protein